jgi:hypothetical protein
MIMGAASLAGGKKAHGAALVWSELLTFKPEHDPENWAPVFPRDKRGPRLRGDHAQAKGWDDDSKKSHPAPGHRSRKQASTEVWVLAPGASTWGEALACFSPWWPKLNFAVA